MCGCSKCRPDKHKVWAALSPQPESGQAARTDVNSALENYQSKCREALTTKLHLRGKSGKVMEALESVEFVGLDDALAQLTQAAQEYVREVIGEDDALRERYDMLEATYHRNKGRNELRSEQRERAGL